MKHFINLALTVTMFLLLIGPALANKDQPPITEALPLAEVLAQLQQDFPRLPADEVQPTPVEGMFSIISGLEIYYFFPQSGHLIKGDLYYRNGKNLTKQDEEILTEKTFSALPLDKALKIGNGPIPVIEVTDPDCPYCRRASDFFDDKDSLVTRYVFFFPIDQLHPNAAAKADWVLSANDGAAAYHQVMKGAYDKTPLPMFKSNGRLAEHRSLVGAIGRSGTPKFFLKGKHVRGANIPELSALLGISPPARRSLQTAPAKSAKPAAPGRH